MNQKDSNIDQEIRNHIRTCILQQITQYSKNQQYEIDYAFKNKNWAISIFLVSVGFCLKEHEELGLFFYFIPLFPIVLFLSMYSLKNFMISKSDRSKKIDELNQIINNLYSLSSEELQKTSQKLFISSNQWKNKGKLDFDRFLNDKIPGMYSASKTLDNIIFFGGMFLFWFFIILIKEIEYIAKF